MTRVLLTRGDLTAVQHYGETTRKQVESIADGLVPLFWAEREGKAGKAWGRTLDRLFALWCEQSGILAAADPSVSANGSSRSMTLPRASSPSSSFTHETQVAPGSAPDLDHAVARFQAKPAHGLAAKAWHQKNRGLGEAVPGRRAVIALYDLLQRLPNESGSAHANTARLSEVSEEMKVCQLRLAVGGMGRGRESAT